MQKQEESAEKPDIQVWSGTAQRIHKNLSSEQGDFIWFQLFIQIILQMNENDLTASHNELVELGRKQYGENEYQLKIIDEFATSYIKTDALLWYTKESFVYHMLNK